MPFLLYSVGAALIGYGAGLAGAAWYEYRRWGYVSIDGCPAERREVIIIAAVASAFIVVGSGLMVAAHA